MLLVARQAYPELLVVAEDRIDARPLQLHLARPAGLDGLETRLCV